MRSARLALVLLSSIGIFWFALASSQNADARKNPYEEFYFHHDHVIGTSLDVWVTAPNESAAETAETAILGEIERLRQIFSLYDESSELSRLNRTQGAMVVSQDMIDVLQQYEIWQQCSHGAFNGQLGALVNVWKEAEKKQYEPDAATLSRIVHQLREPGWRIDGGPLAPRAESGSRSEPTTLVTRLTDQPLNLNSIAKGYIIQKAAAAARAKVASLQGLLLNLGGDMAIWGKDELGRPGFVVGVQNPHEPHDNATPIARLRLRDQAIATSGGYERYYTIHARRHSHIFDPRTGRSADGAASATVVAGDNVTANALATTLCVLTPEEGLNLVAETPGAECLLIGKDGTQYRSAGFAMYEIAFVGDKDKQEKKADGWPNAFQVNITLSLPKVDMTKRYRKPYVAVWFENADAKPVRTLAVWGNNPRWITTLPQWWKIGVNDNALVKAVSRATRSPGKYTLAWDGKDDQGKPLAQGTYTIHVEVHREHGKLVRQTGKIVCGAEAAKVTLAKNAETEDTLVAYAKKK